MKIVSTPCIPFDDLPEPLRERLAPRVERLGYLGEFFQRAAHQPRALAEFFDWTEALKAALPPRVVEAIALTVATRAGNDYERVQHERLALKTGMSKDEVLALESGRTGDVETIVPLEAAAAALARCLVDEIGAGCQPALLRLSRLGGEPFAVACLMTAARYIAHAAMANAWELKPPVGSPFDAGEGEEAAR
ncbi:MAG TPA: carboxymuconolactone decarboxylase family protein [Solirubrobacterales bacterium]|nr:carboxymuconolactone decarboxylase family protein [Solirubrobacterales bacterium]